MARTTEKIGRPYEVLLTRDGDRLVEVVIRTVGDGVELDHDTLSAALRTLSERLRQDADREQRRAAEPLTGPLLAMNQAWTASGGAITPHYLASLAVAYESVTSDPSDHRSVTLALADAIRRPPATVKGHIVRSRKEGFLSPVGHGQTGGQATEKARTVLNG